jgi:hypothetical protein
MGEILYYRSGMGLELWVVDNSDDGNGRGNGGSGAICWRKGRNGSVICDVGVNSGFGQRFRMSFLMRERSRKGFAELLT